jgi:hypothetical protein
MRKFVVLFAALFIAITSDQLGFAQTQSEPVIPVPTLRVEVVGKVLGIHAEDGKPCVRGRTCWWVLTIETGYNSEWNFYMANGHPILDKGQFVCVDARISASGGKPMTKAEIAAKLPRMESVESTSVLIGTYAQENVAEAEEVERRLEKGIAAPPPGYRLLNVQDDPETFSTTAFLNGLVKQKGGKFQVPQQEGIHIVGKVVDSLRHAETVNQIDLYKTIGGYDGSTTSVGAEKLKRLYIGKYYMLPGDVFQIDARENYPVAGKNKFTAFGNINLVGSTYVPVNVICFSAIQVPPYRSAPILGKIVDFVIADNRAGEKVIVPVIKVVMVYSMYGSSNNGQSDFIINPQ